MLSDDTGNKYAMPSHNEPGHHRFIFIIETGMRESRMISR